MAKKQLGYSDALRVLGRDDPALLDLASKLTDGALGAAGVPDLLGARGALVTGGLEAVRSLGRRIRGTDRAGRTEQIEAALKVLAAVSFFTAADEALSVADAPFTLGDLRLTAEEQWHILRHADHGLESLSTFTIRHEDAAYRQPFHQGADVEQFIGHLAGLAQWEALDETQQSRLLRALKHELVERAERHYRDEYLRLSAEVPELRLWTALASTEKTRGDVLQGLQGVADTLEEMRSHRPLDQRREELAALYTAALRRPVLRSIQGGTDLVFPTAEDAYLAPRGRHRTATGADSASSTAWWKEVPLLEDLQPHLTGLLLDPQSTQVPIVVLGHPGAGKSMLTEMLSARLPAEDFLTVRVELRGAAPNAPVQTQIDEALQHDLHIGTPWRELAASAEGALPVVILDGFDELLQATGVDRSDYLEQVQEFQLRQHAMGQPVVVVVTSRTVVADRARIPRGAPVLRLEPFDEKRIAALVDVWNDANRGALQSRGLRPCPDAAVLAHRSLAEQPLLLMMLLLYDGEANALQRSTANGAGDRLRRGPADSGAGMSRAALYEELLELFARREVAKHHTHLSDADMAGLVDDEMRRLEVAAVAMFVRHKQSITAPELEHDLSVLLPGAELRADNAGLHGQIPAADQVIGRFFFIHESRARRSGGTAHTYEFLHATFGEYLVARMVAAAVRELVEEKRSSRRRRYAAPLDDGLLFAVASFAVFSVRMAVVEFLEDLFAADARERAEMYDVLLALFHEAPYPRENRSFSDYSPARETIVQRQGAYRANLLLLLVCLEGKVDAAELYPDRRVPWEGLRSDASAWRGMYNSEWHSLIDALRVRHLFSGTIPRTVVCREDGSPLNLGECTGFEWRGQAVQKHVAGLSGSASQSEIADVTDPYRITKNPEDATGRLLRSVALRCNGTPARMMLQLGPLLGYVHPNLMTWYGDGTRNGVNWSPLHELALLQATPPGTDAPRRAIAYRRLLNSDPGTVGPLELGALRAALMDFSAVGTGLVDDAQGNTENKALVDALLVLVRDCLGSAHTLILGPWSTDEVDQLLGNLDKLFARTHRAFRSESGLFAPEIRNRLIREAVDTRNNAENAATTESQSHPPSSAVESRRTEEPQNGPYQMAPLDDFADSARRPSSARSSRRRDAWVPGGGQGGSA